MATEPIDCRQLVEMVTDYLEDALSTRQVSDVRDHLSGCEDCNAFVAQMRVVIVLNGSTFDADGSELMLPPGKRDSILQSFRQRSTSG